MNAQAKYALVWADVYGDFAYTPKIAFFETLAAAEAGRKEKGREQGNIFLLPTGPNPSCDCARQGDSYCCQ